MKHLFKYILVSVVFLAGFYLKSGAQTIRAEAKLQQYTIRIGDQTKLFLSVHTPVMQHVTFPKLVDTITSKVLVVSTNKPDTLLDQNDRTLATITQGYTITSFDAATYTLPPFSVKADTSTLKTNELTLQVVSVKVDTTKAIYDIKQPLQVSYTFVDWLKDNWAWVVFPILAILAIAGIFYYLKKRPKKEALIKIAEPVIPAHIIALNKLNELRGKKLWQQEEVKQYFSELSDVLREYIEKRYMIKTHEKTTEEIFESMRRLEIKKEDKDSLHRILLLADLVKFAKEKPLPIENEQSLDDAIIFVTSTQRVTAVDKLEGGDQGV